MVFVLPALLVALALLFYTGFSAPRNFIEPKYVRIEKGSSLLETGTELKKEGIVRSKTVFIVLEKIASAERAIKAGDYFFDRSTSVFDVVTRLAKGEFGIEQRKLIVREGETIKEIAELMRGFQKFNEQEFLELTKGEEGYLFPDTYFLFVNVTAQELMQKMKDNFSERTKVAGEDIKNSGKSLNEIITMASIIEKEVAVPEERAIVSGILWKRISKGMPLQVDASLGYVTGKTSAQLTMDDLKMDSPYNTYLHKGLPPAPICNPGLETIKSALNSQPSPYYFYLTGKDGKTYFAKTFDEHKKNKEKYLR